MLIKSIELYNFRQFKGKQKLTFSCDPERNVTVLLGDNTLGKTTILQAFNWCLYGKTVFPKDSNPNFLLNYEIAQEYAGVHQTCNVYVEISLEHKGLEYIIRRKQIYANPYSDVWNGLDTNIEISWIENGISKTVTSGNERKIINTILPESLSEYFFFDTERVSDIGTKKDLAEAVQGLLGLAPVKNARDHLGSRTNKSTVLGKWDNALDKNGDEKAENALKTINENNEQIEKLRYEIQNAEQQVDDLKKQKEEIDQKIRDNQDTAELQKRKEELEKELEDKKIKLEEDNLEFKNYFAKKIVNYLAIPLYDDALEVLKNSNVDDKGISDMTATSIMEIIARGRCICGAEIKSGENGTEANDAYRNIIHELQYLPPEHMGTSIRNYKEAIFAEKDDMSDFFKILKKYYSDISGCRVNIGEFEDKIEEIEKNISKEFDMDDYENRSEKIKQLIKNENDKITKANKQMGVCENTITSSQKIIDSLVSSSENNKKLIECMAYAEKICEWIDNAYNQKENEIKKKLQDKVNEMFSKMYHGERRVEIDKDYKVILYSNVNGVEKVTGESEGLKRVKNFAFIAGLVDLAKERAIMGKDKDSISWENEAYPLVMDAPFSNADETHIRNISKTLPEVANQVIMFVMEKDWQYAKDVMQAHVGKKCSLIQKTETYTEIQN